MMQEGNQLHGGEPVPKAEESQESQKGTLFSVLMVGAFIALMFAGVFWLYMIRA